LAAPANSCRVWRPNDCVTTSKGNLHMGLFDAFSYKGKRAVVVGGATGMGAAVAAVVQDAGAEVVVMDRAEITMGGVKAISLNLGDKASIEAAVAECGGPVDVQFPCASVADG